MTTHPTVLTPFPVEADGAEVVVWDGGPLPADDVLDRVGLFVVPYTFAPWATDPLRRGLPALRAVQSLTAGVEHLAHLVPPGVDLCNARGVHDASTAELAVGLTIASLRRFDEAVRAQDAHHWAHARHPALADRRVLVVGWGSIGQAVGRRLAPFECEVVPVASQARSEPDGTVVHGIDELPDLLPTADVVVLVVPLTAATRHLVDARFLAALPDGALVVNVARGAVVDTDALLAELATGRLRAAVDVTDPEPPPAGHPLWDAPGLLLTPHVGGNTTAFEPRARRLVQAQVRRFVAGGPLENVVP
ncbi:dihydrofolate reductase [Actinotalea ferrariae CF5-4]|uniref:Dihydrofolate reductase n=1 Tax=Actinotalea ferrariae CF5-4 TaxID=948458 RepID=A0A021VZU1_9CELL|nr:2-hydroxyacid dehydrogenase [Actinotalea ferrariae]EYR64592.1 dihydrofolate reductase [Actinotalea ferrariae CF5-4]